MYLIVKLDLTSLYYLKGPTSSGQVFHKTGETGKKKSLLRAAVPQISPAVIAWLTIRRMKYSLLEAEMARGSHV